MLYWLKKGPHLTMTAPEPHQKRVNSHFNEAALYWAQVYERDDDVSACIYQERLRIVIELVNTIALLSPTRVLEIGCGAGYGAVALAGLGHVVDAVDTVQAMVDATRDLAAKAGLAGRIRSGLGDIHALPFADGTFGLVVAMGVLPWLPSIDEPMREIHRVLHDGGYLIVNVDNRWGLRQFLDPLKNPLLRPMKEFVKALLRRLGRSKAESLVCAVSTRECDAVLRDVGIEKLDGTTLGFGPFSVFAYEPVPNFIGLKVHRYLQSLAARRIPLIRVCGGEYIVLGRKKRAVSSGAANANATPPLEA